MLGQGSRQTLVLRAVGHASVLRRLHHQAEGDRADDYARAEADGHAGTEAENFEHLATAATRHAGVARPAEESVPALRPPLANHLKRGVCIRTSGGSGSGCFFSLFCAGIFYPVQCKRQPVCPAAVTNMSGASSHYYVVTSVEVDTLLFLAAA